MSEQQERWEKVAGIVTDTPMVIPVGTHYELLWTLENGTYREVGYIFREADATTIIDLRAQLAEALSQRQAAVEEAERLRGELHEWVNMYPASLVLAPDKLLERTLARCAGLKGKLAAANQDREKARRIAGDLSNQAYESTGLGGVFFDTLHDLRHALASQPPAEAEGDRMHA